MNFNQRRTDTVLNLPHRPICAALLKKCSFFLILFLFFIVNKTFAQVCTGAFGDIAQGTTFGKGTADYGGALNASNTGVYGYVTGQPGDGFYTIAKTTAGMPLVPNNWHLVTNHTAGETDGYMMVINADYNPGIFYQAPVNDLCPNTTYEFAAYVCNILKVSGINPKLTFTIENPANGQILARYDTPEIPTTASPVWEKQSMVFTTPAGVTSVVIRIRNNAPGGNGNDLALDDITFRPCGPKLTPSIDAAIGQQANLCEGQTKSFLLAADVQSGYNVPEFQWQHLVNGNWIDVIGEKTKQLTVSYVNATPGTDQYRLLVAETGSISSPNCRTASPPFILTVNSLTAITATSNSPVCLGSEIQLNSNEGTAYAWTGPNGYTSTERAPIISNATTAMAGIYTLTLTNASGCQMTTQTVVQIDLPPIATVSFSEITICEGEGGTTLSASGGTTYTWSPAAGLSATNIANPVANPTETTVYTVVVSNGSCQSTATVKVNVNKAAVANAGPDKTIVEGQSIVLNGTVSGDNVTYYWTPVDYLDDPRKPNPVANPPGDMVYTLNVVSTVGCVDSYDDVFVKVYKKVIVQNTFSPNGDGINDTWKIVALDAYPKNTVQVFNRNGAMIFNSIGYKSQWDGKYKGTVLPTGVYYYIIYLDEVNKQLSGWVTIIK